jgi:hypothetical protein
MGRRGRAEHDRWRRAHGSARPRTRRPPPIAPSRPPTTREDLEIAVMELQDRYGGCGHDSGTALKRCNLCARLRRAGDARRSRPFQGRRRGRPDRGEPAGALRPLGWERAELDGTRPTPSRAAEPRSWTTSGLLCHYRHAVHFGRTVTAGRNGRLSLSLHGLLGQTVPRLQGQDLPKVLVTLGTALSPIESERPG